MQDRETAIKLMCEEMDWMLNALTDTGSATVSAGILHRWRGVLASPLSAPPQEPTGAKLASLEQALRAKQAEALSAMRSTELDSDYNDGRASAYGDALVLVESIIYAPCQLCGKPQPCSVHGRTPVSESDYQSLARDVEPTGASPQAYTSANVRALTVHICEDCLNLRGEMCNEPGCRFCRRTMAKVAEYLDVLLIRPRIDGVSVLVDEGTPLPPVSPVEPTGASPQAETGEEALKLRDELATRILCVPFRGADVKPAGPYLLLDDVLRVMERPDLGKALDTSQPAPVSPVEPTPEPETCAWRLNAGNRYSTSCGRAYSNLPWEVAEWAVCPRCKAPLRLVPSEETK